MEKVIQSQQNRRAWSGFKTEHARPQPSLSGNLNVTQTTNQVIDRSPVDTSANQDDAVIYSTWFMAGHHLSI